MKDFSTKHKEDFELLCESFSPRLLLISEDNNDTYFQTIIDSINMMLRKDKKNGRYRNNFIYFLFKYINVLIIFNYYYFLHLYFT